MTEEGVPLPGTFPAVAPERAPLARALIGKFSGDIAQVQAPGGLREYEVLDVRYE